MSLATSDVSTDQFVYRTLVGTITAAIFTTGYHDELKETLVIWVPGAISWGPITKVTSVFIGFLLGVIAWSMIDQARWFLIQRLLTYRGWLTQPKTLKTKAWATALQLLVPRKKLLYTFQDILPKYPLPKLSDTCKRFLKVVEPLVPNEEFEIITKDMKEFESDEGPKLQAILQKRYQEEDNWIADLWDKFAYLSHRSSILVNTNIACSSAFDKIQRGQCKGGKQAAYAACLSYYHLRFEEKVRNGTLHPLLAMNIVPMCMNRYKYLMSCTRIPGMQFDELETYKNSKHIIVIRKGLMYRIDVYGTTSSGEERLISPQQLQRQMEMILEDTKYVKETKRNAAVFTAQDRTTWKKDREILKSNVVNAASLNDSERAIFHVVLENTTPANISEEIRLNFCSNGYNRWCDKSLTLTVHENSLAGYNMEHTTAEVTLLGRPFEYAWYMAEYDANGDAMNPADEIFPSESSSPKLLNWDLSHFQEIIPTYEKNVAELCDNVDIISGILPNSSKGKIKKCRVSPDGFMQMALQLAYYRMHKSTPKTYETGLTRFFNQGRTETIRSVSKYSVEFTKKMDDLTVPRAEVISLLKQAISYQTRYKLDAMNGEASDRHMFGLYVASKMAGLQPKLFKQQIFTSPDKLSTSQAPASYDTEIMKRSKYLPTGGCFGALHPEGYGVYYFFIDDNAMTINITSYHSCAETNSKKYKEEIVKAMDDMLSLLQQQ